MTAAVIFRRAALDVELCDCIVRFEGSAVCDVVLTHCFVHFTASVRTVVNVQLDQCRLFGPSGKEHTSLVTLAEELNELRPTRPTH